MKLDLPRKRKKACIKAIGKINYLGCKILNEILLEQKGKKVISYPKVKKVNGINIIIGKY
jgi:hypothetical protein